MRKFLTCLFVISSMSSLMSSCSDSDEEDCVEVYAPMYYEVLNGDYVAYTKVTVNGVDKTLLETGCPTLLRFSWENDSLKFTIPEMKIGSMPFAISFRANCAITQLNPWEADEHSGGNSEWIKFVGKYGYVSTGGDLLPNGSSIVGYYNIYNNTIEFEIDYNVMNVRTVCERQTLDVNRTRDYDSLMEQYIKELNKAKESNGLDKIPTIGTLDSDARVDSTIPQKYYISSEGVKGILSGDVVINTDVTVSGSAIAKNVPTSLELSWKGDVMTVKITDLQMGSMPFAISFSCDCTNTSISEDDDYSYPFYKFVGKNGVVSSDPAFISSNEGEFICYFNPSTMEIAATIDFKASNAVAEAPLQKLKF